MRSLVIPESGPAVRNAIVTGTIASSFTRTNICGVSLSVGASCAASATYKPATGRTLTASLSIADNATGSPQAVTLAGTGVLPVPVVTLLVGSLSFPATAVTVNNPAATATVALFRTGL